MPVIAVTAYAMLGDRDAALAAGFDGYLAKPIDPARLAESIEAYLPDQVRSSAGHRAERSAGAADMTTVLIVDDRAVNRDLVRTVLGYHGYETVEAEDGPDALALLQHNTLTWSSPTC